MSIVLFLYSTQGIHVKISLVFSMFTRFERLVGYTFFLYKNLVYKNVQAEICPKIKNIIRTWPASNFLTRFANEQEQKGIKTNKQLFDHISYYIYSPLDNCMEGVD